VYEAFRKSAASDPPPSEKLSSTSNLEPINSEDDEKEKNDEEIVNGNFPDLSPLTVIKQQAACVAGLSQFSSSSFSINCVFSTPPQQSPSPLNNFSFSNPLTIGVDDVLNGNVDPLLLCRINDIDIYWKIILCVLHSLIRIPPRWVFILLLL
jgi:hypothetical protein